MAHSPMKEHPLAIAARYNDAECEEHGIEPAIARLELEIEDVFHIAEQRALRLLWIELGRDMAIFKNPYPIALGPFTTDERKRLVILQSAILDGILIGWRAAKF